MARFNTSGIDDLIREVTALGENSEMVGKKMLIAGAEEVKKAWKEAAIKHNLRETGDMIDSIGYDREPKTVNDIQTIDIYPRGKDRKGVRNVEKAFILHYGTSSKASIKKGKRAAAKHHKKYTNPGIPATHWVDDADKMSEEPVKKAFEEIWDEFLKGGSTK